VSYRAPSTSRWRGGIHWDEVLCRTTSSPRYARLAERCSHARQPPQDRLPLVSLASRAAKVEVKRPAECQARILRTNNAELANTRIPTFAASALQSSPPPSGLLTTLSSRITSKS